MMITAHSGCDGTAMNTMEYISHAASLPIDALEIDIRRGKTGGLVLTHDPVGLKPLVTLEEAFSFLADKKVMINCDLKEYGLEDDLLSCAKAFGVEDRIILTGSVTDCMNFHRKHPDVKVFINAEELVQKFYTDSGKKKLIERCHQAGYNVINIDYHACDIGFIKSCRDAGIGLSLWTVDDPAEQKIFLEEYNITTNNTSSILSCFGKSRE